jgi:hypothetical protein
MGFLKKAFSKTFGKEHKTLGDARNTRRTDRRAERKSRRVERRDARQLRIKTRQDAKTERKGKGGGVLDSIVEGATKILGPEKMDSITPSMNDQQGEQQLNLGSLARGVGADASDIEQTVETKTKMPLIIGGVVIVLGVVGYMFYKKSKKNKK